MRKMIYTLTFNPAIDLVIQVPNCTLGNLNRSTQESYVVGGKGINMSVVLNRLGKQTIATGFLGGFSGEYIEKQLEEEGIQTHFIPVEGITRINVKVKSNEETEINAAGAVVSTEQLEQLLRYLSNELKEGDVVFLAGNNAPGLTSQAYLRVAQLCQEKNVLLVLDTNKELLTECLPYRPFLIKPNHHELGEIFNTVIHNREDIMYYAEKLQQQGARNVLVSRGGEGALLMTEDGHVFESNVPKGQVVNSVGAGDSMLAGFMACYLDTKDYALSLQQGAATGSATAFSTGIATKDYINELLQQINITKER